MSDRADATPSVWSRRALGGLGGGSAGFAQDRRFVRAGQGPGRYAGASPTAEAAPIDPLTEAWTNGYAEGAAAAQATAEAAHAAQDAARYRIESALQKLDAEAVAALEQRLRSSVLALCETVLADAALDPQALSRRVQAAAAMFARAADERVIRLHPEDLALVHARLPEDWHCEPDSSLERGALRVESASGGVEDGPAQWRRALDEALRAC